MGTEIERKFLLADDSWRGLATGKRYCQGYICAGAQGTVRIRTIGDSGFVTIKGPTRGLARAEYEYPIPVADAREMLAQLCRAPLIEKVRYTLEFAGSIWEVDEFERENAGLVLAEIELEQPQQTFVMPPWLGREVSDDPRYRNSALALHPYGSWDKK